MTLQERIELFKSSEQFRSEARMKRTQQRQAAQRQTTGISQPISRNGDAAAASGKDGPQRDPIDQAELDAMLQRPYLNSKGQQVPPQQAQQNAALQRSIQNATTNFYRQNLRRIQAQHPNGIPQDVLKNFILQCQGAATRRYWGKEDLNLSRTTRYKWRQCQWLKMVQRMSMVKEDLNLHRILPRYSSLQ